MTISTIRHGLNLIGVMGCRTISALGGFILSVSVARIFGAETLGGVAVFLALVGTSTMIARRGFDLTLTREVARLGAIDSLGHTKRPGAAVWGGIFKFFVSKTIFVILTLILVVSCLIILNVLRPLNLKSILPFSAFLISFVIAGLYAGILRGQRRSGLATFFELGSISGLGAALIWIFWLVFGESINPYYLLAFAALILATIPIALVFRKTTSIPDFEACGSVFFMLWAVSAFVLQAGSFVLAAPFLEIEALGHLRAAERLSALISFPMISISAYIAPLAVDAAASGNRNLVMKLFTRCVVLSSLLCALPTALLLAYPQTALTVFGGDFAGQEHYLIWMSIASFVFAALAPGTMILSMCGSERSLAYFALFLMTTLIPAYMISSYIFGAKGFLFVYCAGLFLRAAGILVLQLRYNWQANN